MPLVGPAGSRRILVAACLINLALTLAVGRLALRHFPNSGDEYADVISATLFAEGRLSVASPDPPRSFDVLQVINDGKFYGKYAPGWPALMSIGMRAGAPWIVNAVLGLVALLLIYRLAAAHFSSNTAAIATITLTASPFLIFNSASFFPHPAALCALTLFLHACLDADAGRQSLKAFAIMGASAGAAFLIRPFTTVAFVVPVVGYLMLRFYRRGESRLLTRGVVISVAAAAPFLLLFLLYNHAQTGNALLQPFSLYDVNDRPFHTPTSLSYWWGLKHNLVERLALLTIWQPLSMVLLFVWLFRRQRSAEERTWPLVAAFVGLLGCYAFYLFGSGNEYGPRYLFEALGALTIIEACAIRRLGRWAMPVLGLIVVLNVGWLYSRSLVYAAEVRERMAPFDLAETQRLTNAIVFVETGAGTMLARDLTRNGIHFDGPVLFVRNLGAANAALLQRYPERRAYAYRVNPLTSTPEIVPLRSRND